MFVYIYKLKGSSHAGHGKYLQVTFGVGDK